MKIEDGIVGYIDEDDDFENVPKWIPLYEAHCEYEVERILLGG